VVRPGEATFDDLYAGFDVEAEPGLRSVVLVEVDRVSDSCGYAVPLMDYVGDRTLLTQWSRRKTEDELVAYRATKNATSIDGLPALA
jgi:hypothetical protein